jgi:hypothetical protein
MSSKAVLAVPGYRTGRYLLTESEEGHERRPCSPTDAREAFLDRAGELLAAVPGTDHDSV